MPIETRRLKANDDSGNNFIIIAERLFEPSPMGIRTDRWRFRLEDGREVTAGPAHGHYFIKEDRTHLTSSDPNEPKD